MLEVGHRVTRREPAEIAAPGVRRVFGIGPRELLETGAGNQPLAQPVDLGLRVGFGRLLVDLDQDVARMRLVDDGRLVAVALLDKLHHVEPARAAQHGRHFAGLHLLHDVREYRRQPCARAPAEVAAGRRIGRVRVRRRDLPEILARAHFGKRLLGHADVDVRQQVFVLAACLRRDGREVVVDLGIRHGDLAVHLAIAHALDRDLAADVFAIVRVRNAFALEHLAELVGRELVLLGHAQDRALDGGVVDADAGFLRVLQHRPLDDQPLEHLLVEHVVRWRRDFRRLHLRQQDAPLLAHVPLRDRLVIDDHEHAVERHRIRRRMRARRHRHERRDEHEQQQRPLQEERTTRCVVT